MTPRRFSQVELVAVAAVALAAAWLRLHQLDQVEFFWDQAEISSWAIRLARGGTLLPVGPLSSTGIDSFPAVIWLLAIPYSVSLSPVVATGFIGLLNVAAVMGTYLLGRRWFGRGAALLAALLFAVTPWGSYIRAKSGTSSCLPPLPSFTPPPDGWLLRRANAGRFWRTRWC